VLITLWEATAAGELDFDRVAKSPRRPRATGARRRSVSQGTIDELVAAVIEILGSIIKLRSN
jgi:hypothetical protein